MVRVNLSVLERLGVFALTALLLALLTASTILAQPPGEPEEPLAPPIDYLDHFWCYRVVNGLDADDKVDLQDQFQDSKVESVDVSFSSHFCNPARKIHGDKRFNIVNRDNHLLWYQITAATAPTETLHVRVKNQFGRRQDLRVIQPAKYLAVPTTKEDHDSPENLDHFQCYKVRGDDVQQTVSLKDQFQSKQGIVVMKPRFLCNPTYKHHVVGVDVTEVFPLYPDAHLVCYQVTRINFSDSFSTVNQIGAEVITVDRAHLLCAPSYKTLVED